MAEMLMDSVIADQTGSIELDTCLVIRRNGEKVPFDTNKIRTALSKAFLSIKADESLSSSLREHITDLTMQVVQAIERRMQRTQAHLVHIEDIQDLVELSLMRAGDHEVCREYILYREERAKARREKMAEASSTITDEPHVTVIKADGTSAVFYRETMEDLIRQLFMGTTVSCDIKPMVQMVMKDIYDGISYKEFRRALILAARTLIERDPEYTYVSAALLLADLRSEVWGEEHADEDVTVLYRSYFPRYIHLGIQVGLLDPRLASLDLTRLADALRPERDACLQYLGLQTLYDRYFLRHDDACIELPQIFFMRIAIGLGLEEKEDPESWIIRFYELLSSFRFMCSTPTLFNSATLRPQLSSCFLSTVPDDLDGIYSSIKDNALLSKFAGGVANDWTQVRALGSRIVGTHGKSQGVVPFLKVVNDTAVAVNQGGKRQGAVVCYLETWHLDIEEFLELRKNTGDERRRTHDMNTANWIPDLFMKRVFDNQSWTLFSPVDVPDLHDKYGPAFEEAYVRYEAMADRGEMPLYKRLPAQQLWRKMLSMLFETGHPWMTFKDPANIRSPQQHVGVVHSSNLCTEITLNTSADEVAVCNLGSVNIAAHLVPTEDGTHYTLDRPLLEETVMVAMRLLDNVIDINHYSIPQARHSNLKHRPVGLGIMGFQDALYLKRLSYASDEAVVFADRLMETIAYLTYSASVALAQERGCYETFEGSLWDKGILPLDSLALLAKARGGYLEYDRSCHEDWEGLRAKMQKYGMRNSNCLAIAPTATISNIVGVFPSIDPAYQNLYVKSNLSGEFTLVNPYLVRDLKALHLWDEVMVADLKYYHGSVEKIDRIPDHLKCLYKTAFEIEGHWLIEAGARRMKWIDQTQSLNLFVAQPSGRLLDSLYKQAWLKGLKTTYYLRTMGATHVEQSTAHHSQLNAVSVKNATSFCSLNDPTCEACQ